MAGQNIFCVPEDKYPILVILMRNRLNTEIFRIVHGMFSCVRNAIVLLAGIYVN